MSEKTTKSQERAKIAQNTGNAEKTTAPERVQAPSKQKNVSTPVSVNKTAQNASDEALRQSLLEGSSPEPNNVNAGAGGRMTIDEMLHTYFEPTDLVTVTNPFDFDTGWVYADPKDIRIEQPSPETRRVYGIGREYQKTRLLHAGESVVLQGWEAYVGLTRFFKQWVQLTYTAEQLSGAMNSQVVFNKFMGLVYKGIFDPNAGHNTPVESEDVARAALENDLGLTDGGNA